MMKVGVFYICTGKYSIFWNTFHESAERYFLPGIETHYFVFTDDKNIRPSDRIHTYYEEPKGFPMDSLLRFDLFLKIEQDVMDCDYLFFFNSNIQFQKEVAPDMILPTAAENGLVGVLHPGYYAKQNSLMLPYEKRRQSTAYIPYKSTETYQYFMGGLNGGTREAYYELIRICSANIHKDMEQDIMAIYHDESHFNCYVHNKTIKELSPSYGFPEDAQLPFEPVCILLNKTKHGGAYFDKLPRKAYGLRAKLFLKRIYQAVLWRMGI